MAGAEDREPFAALNADPVAMEHFPAPLGRSASDALADQIERRTEIGWRLARAHWGNGYASEAAGACLDYTFDTLRLAAVVSLTTVANRRSRRVMERLGMTHDPTDDFDHPLIPAGDPQRRHVLYRLTREEWLRRRRA